MNAEKIRYQNDLEMYESLLKVKEVIKVNETISKMQEDGPSSTRRHLLATSVYLSKRMAPEIHKMADECYERLELEIPLELYVYSSPQFNAACFKPEAGRLLIMFSSSLLEAFEDSELRFVMGHELGHHVYRHHDIPIGYILRGEHRPDPKLALELFSWSRNAEISADRAGAFCAQDLNGVAKSLFKLASGLTGKSIQFNLEDFISQVDQMKLEDQAPGLQASREDWFSTHPFSPLRVKALQLFHDSELMMPGGTSVTDLEVGVQRTMSMMEPSYIDARTDTAQSMRRVLFAGAIAVANSSGKINDKEIEAFEGFFGKGKFKPGLNIARIIEELPSRIDRCSELASITQRMQVMRDLCIVSKADGRTTAKERATLNEVANGLKISRSFICQCMDKDIELD
ncbi:MAG: tellurite resistance protein [Saprospiraceae bacterium]|jgi:tellurite resistance protein